MSIFNSPFLPVFGSGAPTVKTNKTALYFDNSTTPFTGYVWDGAWRVFGVVGNINATEIQSIPVSATAPTSGQTLKYDGAEYTPA
jgi:hypothetical protein